MDPTEVAAVGLRRAANVPERIDMAEPQTANATILGLISAIEERKMLESMFDGSKWRLRFVRTIEEVRIALDREPISVIISDTCLSDGHGWKDVLNEICDALDAPPLIVADRLADEALWGEVLNLGGFDLLMKPLVTKEVLHVVSAACRFRQTQKRTTAAA
jgi:DNA-binding NtrC family response regulator